MFLLLGRGIGVCVSVCVCVFFFPVWAVGVFFFFFFCFFCCCVGRVFVLLPFGRCGGGPLFCVCGRGACCCCFIFAVWAVAFLLLFGRGRVLFWLFGRGTCFFLLFGRGDGVVLFFCWLGGGVRVCVGVVFFFSVWAGEREFTHLPVRLARLQAT